MNRRSVIGGILAMMFAPLVKIASASTVAKSKRKLKITYEWANPGWLGSVTGSKEDQIAFYEAWQTSMWPDWRTSEADHGRKRFEEFKAYVAKGKSGLYCLGVKAENWLVKAFVDAIEVCWDKCDSVEPMPEDVCRRHGYWRVSGTRTSGLLAYWEGEKGTTKSDAIEKARIGKNPIHC